MSSFFRFKIVPCHLNFLLIAQWRAGAPLLRDEDDHSIQQMNERDKLSLVSVRFLWFVLLKLRYHEAAPRSRFGSHSHFLSLPLPFALQCHSRRWHCRSFYALYLHHPPPPKARELKLDSIRVHWTPCLACSVRYVRSFVCCRNQHCRRRRHWLGSSIQAFLSLLLCYSPFTLTQAQHRRAASTEGVGNCLWMRKARCHINNKSCAEESTPARGLEWASRVESRCRGIDDKCVQTSKRWEHKIKYLLARGLHQTTTKHSGWAVSNRLHNQVEWTWSLHPMFLLFVIFGTCWDMLLFF